MRIVLLMSVFAGTMFLAPRPSKAYEGPWCALTDIGGGVMQENCSMRTLEMCRQEVIAGNRQPALAGRAAKGPSGVSAQAR
jgi:hypothetical protein